MYGHTAQYYNEIFPLSEAQLNLVSSITPPGGRILDVGCATGELAIALTRAGFQAEGIDLDPEFIQKAREQASTLGDRPAFTAGAMEEIDRFYRDRSFDTVVCLGNTLVHGDGPEGIKNILTKIGNVLVPGGTCLIQVLNYRHILDSNVTTLPVIETEHVWFERRYSPAPRKEGFLSFTTTLYIQEKGPDQSGQGERNKTKVTEGSVTLYPLTKEEIPDIVRDAGFNKPKFYGDYRKNPLTECSFPLLFETSKM